MSDELDPDVPRERQRLRLPASKLRRFREWATEGSGLAVGARVRDDDGRIALVRNGWSDGWVLPGGGVEVGERPVEAVRREVREETGLRAIVDRPLVVFEQSYVDGSEGEVRFSARYVVYAARAEGSIPDASRLGVTPGEISAARWFETVPETLHDGEALRRYL